MDQLQQVRAQIDEIDAKMAALFEQRMQAVGQVAQYKRAPANRCLTRHAKPLCWKRIPPACRTRNFSPITANF